MDVKALVNTPAIRRQLDKINPELIKKELEQWGAWDDTELEDVEQNRIRIVWMAACNISEENT